MKKNSKEFKENEMNMMAAGGEQIERLPGGGFHGGEQIERLPGGGFHGGEQIERLPGGGFHGTDNRDCGDTADRRLCRHCDLVYL